MKWKIALILSVLAVLAVLMLGCGKKDLPVKSRTLKHGLRRISVLSYTPEDFDFRGGRTPLLLFMGDGSFNRETAFRRIEENGLRELADRESCTVVILSPANGKSWQDKDYTRLQTVAGSTSDTWFPDGRSTVDGFADGLFLASHFRLYVFAEGRAAEYVKKTLDVPGADFFIREYGMNCGGFAAAYLYAPEGFTKESVAAGWESVKDRTRIFTDKDTSLACLCPDCGTCGVHEMRKTFTAPSGREIGYYEYVPDTLTVYDVTPLVVLFHGRGMHPDAYAYHSAWPLIAAKHGFRLLSVEGPYNKEFSPDIDTQITADTHALIADYAAHAPIDTGHIFATGFSMGAFRVLDLAARYPQTFAAVAPCDFIRRCIDLTSPLPVFLFGGAKDNYHIFPTENVWCGPLVKNIAEANGCNVDFDAFAGNIWGIRSENERTVTDADTGIDIRIRELKDSRGNTRVVLSEAENMGHTVLPKMSELIWAFFESVS